MTVDVGDWNVGGSSDDATGPLKAVRERWEALELGTTPPGAIDWMEQGDLASPIARMIDAILQGALAAGGGGYKREDVTDQVAVGEPGPETVSFVTKRQFGDGRTRAVMNGIRDFSLTRNTSTTFDFDPYSDGFGPRAGDVVIIEEVVQGWEEITVPGGTSLFVTESTYLTGWRMLLNGVFWTEGVTTVDGKNWVIEPYGPGTEPLLGDTLHVEGPVDAFGLL